MKIRTGIWAIMMVLMVGNIGSAEIYQKIGPSTNLPIPRYISLRGEEAFMRRGPSQNHKIDWIYHRKGYPLRVIGESGHWRKVEDWEGVKGWFHYALLSSTRTVIVTADKATLHAAAAENGQMVAILQKGVIAKLKSCTQNWCEVEIDNLDGWLPKSAFWGVDADEVFED